MSVAESKTNALFDQQAKGLPSGQEPKYTVDGNSVVNRHTGEAIPHDEPIFVFRARDALSVRALEAYLSLICEREPSSAHAEAVRARIADFRRFANTHQSSMKWPDTATQTAKSEPLQQAALQPAPDCHHRPPCDEGAALAAQGGKT